VAESILTSVKKVLGIAADYDAFDPDIVMHINSVFSTLNDLGIGPVDGYMIEDATPTWDAFIGTTLPLNAVKSYVCFRVRLMFDPPQTSYMISALENQIKELEWRLNTQRENVSWTDPNIEVE